MFTHAHVDTPHFVFFLFCFLFCFLLTIKIRLRNKPEIDLSRPLISLISCHVSSTPFLSWTPKQDDWNYFSETAVLFGRASSGLHCTMNPHFPPTHPPLPNGFLLPRGCFVSCWLDAVFLCVLSVLRDGGTIVMFTLTKGGFGLGNMSKTKPVLVLEPIKQGDCIL